MNIHEHPDTDVSNNIYPFPSPPPPQGSLHLRSYDTNAEATRSGDIAAVAVAQHAAGHDVLVLCSRESEQQQVSHFCGLGWREPRLKVLVVHDLLGATAELYRAWFRAAGAPVTVIVTDIQHPDTGFESGHDDNVATTWLQAVQLGDAAAVGNVAGLAWESFTKLPVPELIPTVVVAGTRRRKSLDRGKDTVMGGLALRFYAHTRLDIVDAALDDTGMVTATAKVVKNRYGAPGVEAMITRPTQVTQDRLPLHFVPAT